MQQKDAELRQVQKEVEKLLQENKTHLQDLEEEKERTCIQVRRRGVLSEALVYNTVEKDNDAFSILCYLQIKVLCAHLCVNVFRLNNLWTSRSSSIVFAATL